MPGSGVRAPRRPPTHASLAALPSGRSESRWPARGIAQFSFFPFDGFIAGDDHLGDAVAGVYLVILFSEVQQDHADFAAIAGIDGGRTVRQRNGVFERQAAARADLRLMAGRQLNREAGGYELRNAWFECHLFGRAQIEARVFQRTVRVLGQISFVAQALDSDFHGICFRRSVIIA